MVIYHVRAAMSVLSRRAVFSASSAAALSAARLDRLAPPRARSFEGGLRRGELCLCRRKRSTWSRRSRARRARSLKTSDTSWRGRAPRVTRYERVERTLWRWRSTARCAPRALSCARTDNATCCTRCWALSRRPTMPRSTRASRRQHSFCSPTERRAAHACTTHT